MKTWRYLQSADHFFYMSDKARDGGLSPFDTPQTAFHYFMQVVEWLHTRVEEDEPTSEDPERINETLEAERRTVTAPVWALSIEPKHGHNN